MPLLPWMKKEREDGSIEISLPEAEQKKINDAASAAAELPAIKEKLSALDGINEFINTFKAEREDAKKKKLQEQQQQQQQTTDEEFETLMLTDPKKAMELVQRPTQIALLKVNAANVRREVFENADKFKYYNGTIKEEVDKLLAGQSLDFQNNPSNVENCYNTIIGRHHDEILEGKIKSRFAGSSGGANGTSSGSAGDTGAGGNKTRVITDDVKKLAKQFGVTAEDYADMLDKEGIGYV